MVKLVKTSWQHGQLTHVSAHLSCRWLLFAATKWPWWSQRKSQRSPQPNEQFCRVDLVKLPKSSGQIGSSWRAWLYKHKLKNRFCDYVDSYTELFSKVNHTPRLVCEHLIFRGKSLFTFALQCPKEQAHIGSISFNAPPASAGFFLQLILDPLSFCHSKSHQKLLVGNNRKTFTFLSQA